MAAAQPTAQPTAQQYEDATRIFQTAAPKFKAVSDSIEKKIKGEKLTKADVESWETQIHAAVATLKTSPLDTMTFKITGGKQRGGETTEEIIKALEKLLQTLDSLKNTDFNTNQFDTYQQDLIKAFNKLKELIGSEGITLTGGKGKKTRKQRGGMYAGVITSDQYAATSSLVGSMADPYAQATAFNAAIYAPQAFNAGLQMPYSTTSELPPSYAVVTEPKLTTGGANKNNKKSNQKDGGRNRKNEKNKK
jgi:hypothetical protein